MTGIVLLVILASKFIHGAWVTTVLAIILLWFFMKAIDNYYKRSHEDYIQDQE